MALSVPEIVESAAGRASPGLPEEVCSPRAAYVHVPFCARRCGYCNFAVAAGRPDLAERYLAALARELAWLEQPRPVHTLFLGGGTPTQLSAGQLERLADLLAVWFPLAGGHEFSVEANPADLASGQLDVLVSRGLTRVSLGAQSFQAAKLARLERDHTAAEICRAASLARRYGLSVSLDLIFAAPGETPADWRADLEAALVLEPDHISTYGLTYERGTTFWSRRARGDLAEVGEEEQRDMLALAMDTLTAAGFEHYEVSNFARPGQRCRHNEVYWRAHGYYAAGPGAARYVAGRRETNHRSTTTWLKRVLAGESPVAESEELSPLDRAREALVLGLRRLQGIDCRAFAWEFGYDVDALGGRALSQFLSQGLLESSGGRLRLTRQGLFVSDSLWPALL